MPVVSQSDAIETLVTATAVESVAVQMGSLACGNCGARLTGRYCAECGQSATDRSKSLARVIGDAAQDFLHLDSRVLRTLGMLLFLPGKMTRQFMDGRRVSFVPPLRLYLFSSLIFFLILSLANVALFVVDLVELQPAATPRAIEERVREAVGRIGEGEHNPEAMARLEAGLRDLGEVPEPMRLEIGNESFVLPPGVGMQLRFFVDLDDWKPNLSASTFARAQTGALLEGLDLSGAVSEDADADESAEDSAAGTPASRDELSSLFGADWARRLLRGIAVSLDHPENLNKVMGDNLAKAMFVLMPLYALLLSLVNIRRRLFMVDHLIFALHLHAFLFVFLTIIVLTQELAPGLTAALTSLTGAQVFFSIIALYNWVAMRWAYGQGAIKTTVKWFLVGSVYSVLLLVTMVTALLISLPDV